MSLINLSVKRPVGTIVLYVGVIMLGAISYSKLAINLLPDLSYPKISVVTHYPGSGPEEIERFITNELEGPLSAITGVKKIDSTSKEGISVIELEFHWGTDMDFALLHTKEQTEGVVQTLPAGCEPPVIEEWDPSASPIMTVILKSDKRNLKEQKEAAEYIIKPRLEQLEGISRVEIRGGAEEEISVEIDPEKIKSIGISLTDVAIAIQTNNIFQPGGTVKKDKLRYILTIEGEVQSPGEIEAIVVRRLADRSVSIKDIGRAFFKNKVQQGNIRFNGRSSISLLVYKEAGGNTVTATQAAQEAFQNMTREFGNEIEFQMVSQEAELIVYTIDSLKSSLILGAFLAFFTLLLFLQNYRDPLLISLVIPISVISTFVLMFAFDVNINIMSLGGLVLGVGMFVDNSIIVLESIYRHREKEQLVAAVINGTKEVGGAIAASTYTTIAIFLPVIYLYGITGKLFRDQALTVSFSLLSSLFVAITLLPALSAYKAVVKTDFIDDLLEKGKGEKRKWYHYPFLGLNFILMIPFKLLGYILYFIIGALYIAVKSGLKGLGKVLGFLLNPLYKGFDKLYRSSENYYYNLLEKILNRKRIALYLTIVLLAGVVVGFILLKKELLATPDSRKFEIRANTISAYGFDQTDRVASDIEKKLLNIGGVTFVFTESGSVSTFTVTSEDISVNSIHYIVECKSPGIRPQAMSRAREILEQADLLDFATYLERNTLSQYLSGAGENFQAKVFYEDLEKGKEAVQLVLHALKDFKNLHDIKTTTTSGKPLYVVEFKQDVLNRFDIPRVTVANFINQAIRGEQAGTMKQVQKNYDIFVRVPLEGVMTINRLASLPITINDVTFFLKDLVELKERPSINKITRESQERYFLISGDARDVRLNELIKKAEAKLKHIAFPANTRCVFSGEEEERRKAFDSLNGAIWLALALVYMIMAAKFENLLQPLFIMFTVPMGMAGAFLFLLLSGNSLNIISGIGLLVIIGIGVNSAIVKVEYSNQLRESGMGIREANMVASRVRLRPILMTALTTIFGVLPMAMSSGVGSELQKPLALVIMGGLLINTLLTLILIPVYYEMVENFKEKRKRLEDS